MDVYSEVNKEGPPTSPNEVPPTPPRRPPPSIRHKALPTVPKITAVNDKPPVDNLDADGDCNEDEDAPPVPKKDPSILTNSPEKENKKPVLKQEKQPKKAQEKGKKKPLPKKRNKKDDPKENVSLENLPNNQDQDEIPSPGASHSNPFYEGIIEMKLPPKSNNGHGAPDKRLQPINVSQAIRIREYETQQSEEATNNIQTGSAVYELARAVHDELDDKISVTDSLGDLDKQHPKQPPPVPIRPHAIRQGNNDGARSKITPQDSTDAQLDSVIVDKYFYNFICTFNVGQLKPITDEGKIHTAEITGGDSREIELRFSPNSKSDPVVLQDKFLNLYRIIEPQLHVESSIVTHVTDLHELENELQNRYKCLCVNQSEKNIDIVCNRKDVSLIRRCLLKHGGVLAPGEQRTESLTSEPIQADHSPKQRSSGVAISYPVGYDVGGAFRLFIYKTDITTLHVDAIVNAANGNLRHGGGVAKAIVDAAGPELEKSGREVLRKIKEIPVSEVVKTSSGKLPCRMVIHAVGPRWSTKNIQEQNECGEKLKKTFENVLDFAMKEGVKTLAMPPISSGKFCVPHDTVAQALYAAIISSVDPARYTKSKLKEVRIVDIADTVLNHIVPLFGSGGRVVAPSGKFVAVTELPSEEMESIRKESDYKKLIINSPTQALKKKNSILGGLCGKGSRKNKYN